jgi:hypothetical protein
MALEEMIQATLKEDEDFKLGGKFESKLVMNDVIKQREEWEKNYKASEEEKRRKREERH